MRVMGWNIFELIWLTVFSAAAISLSILWKDSIFGFSVFITGVLCVVLAAKGNIWTYYFGMYNSIAYAWLSYQNGLYGETMLNALFFVPMNIVGWFAWHRKMEDKAVSMRKLTLKGFLLAVLLCAAGTLLYGYWLSTLKGQNSAYIDAFTNSASITATIIMILRYREQWLFYFSINALSIVMWSLRLAQGSSNAATMVIMWSAYLINSIYGFYVWNKGSKLEVIGNESVETAVEEGMR